MTKAEYQAIDARFRSVFGRYASRECRMCGYESAENRKTQSVFSCVACGHTENADVHAAKVILASPQPARSRYTLTELLAGMNPGDMPTAPGWSDSRPEGREAL